MRCWKCRESVFRNGWLMFFYNASGDVQCTGCTPREPPFSPMYIDRVDQPDSQIVERAKARKPYTRRVRLVRVFDFEVFGDIPPI